MPQTRAPGRENPLQSNQPTRIPRSSFDRSYRHLTTIDAGILYPLHIDEVLPGDTLNLRPAFFVRMATPLKPFMDGLWFEYQCFFVPYRQLWTNFVKMMGERDDPADNNDFTTPQMTPPSGGHLVGSLSDYLTIPVQEDIDPHSSMFHRAYNHIYNTWYRDADLQDSVVVDMDNGPDTETDYVLLRRGKRKDYLTGARPFAQRGTAVTLPLGSAAPVVVSAGDTVAFGTAADGAQDFQVLSTGIAMSRKTGTWSATQDVTVTSGMEADLTSATAASINTIRTALATQHVLERDARGGGRYWEVIGNHFNVYPDHIQLQRPELLMTGSVSVNAVPVAQTGVSEVFKPLGGLAAYVTASQVGRGFVKSFQEHGIIMLLGSVRAELTYQQGLNRMFSRLTRFDHYWPDFAHIGEQAVLSKEIFADGAAADQDVWGYQPRYEEYRHRDSVITGEFRSAFSGSLDVWHIALDFATRPVLNAAFIEENPPVIRLIATSTDAQFLCDSYFKIAHTRPMPRFATPGMTRF